MPRRDIQFINDTDRPWLMVVFAEEPDGATWIAGVAGAEPGLASARLTWQRDDGRGPQREAVYYAALLSDLHLDPVIVSTVITTPLRVTFDRDRDSRVLHAVVRGGSVRLQPAPDDEDTLTDLPPLRPLPPAGGEAC